MFFWNSLAFLMIQRMLTIWFLVPLPFLKPAGTSGSSRFTYYWSLAWRILSITLLACEMSAIVRLFEHSLAFPFFGIGMKTDLFQSCGHCWISRFAGILSAGLSQHHLSGFEIAHLEIAQLWNSSSLCVYIYTKIKTEVIYMKMLKMVIPWPWN